MFALDLFNTDHERRLAEGAVDQLEQRRIDDLAMKMDDLVARAKTATTPEVKQALMKEFQKCKAERDDYFKIKDECMGYGSLVGEAGQVPTPTQPVRAGTDLVTPQQRVAGATPPSTTALGKAKETFTSFANWLAGKDDTGPTYESAVEEQAAPISPVTAAKYAYEQMRKAHDDNVDIATIRWMNNPEPITMSRNQLYHTLIKLKSMSRQNRNQFALQTLADRNNFALWMGGQKKVTTRPQLKQPSDPFQPQLPLGKPQTGAPVQERAQKKNSDDSDLTAAAAGDVKVARELQKIRAKHPAARSDLEALAKDELDHQARSNQQLDAIKGANTKQDALLKQLVALDQEQGREIDGLDSENNSLEAQLARIQATNDRLQKTIQSMSGTKKSVRAKQTTTDQPTTANAEPEVEKKLQGLEAQIQNLQTQPQSPEIVKQIEKLQNQINSLPAKAAQALNIDQDDSKATKKQYQAPRVQAPLRDLDVAPSKAKATPKAKAKPKAPPAVTPVTEPEDEFDLLNIDESAKKLHPGDPVVVTAPNEFEGKTGEIHELSPSGSFVIVNLYNHGKHSMHLSDVEYNDYADQEEEDDWYNEMDESTMSELDAMRQDLERMNDRQFLSAYGMSKQAFQQKYRTVLNPAQAQDTPVLDRNRFEKHTTKKNEFNIGEGFQDFNKVEPYAVCLAGKPVKKFDYYEEARRFHDNWKKKLYREGDKAKADKITLMPILDEDNRSPERVAADKLKAAEQTAKFIMRNWDDRQALKMKAPLTWSPERFYQGATAAMRGASFDDVVKIVYQDAPAWFPKNEAANPAQQAAIAINMKKAGKKPKHVDETALNPRDPAGDYAAKRKALQNLGMNKAVDQQVVLQRRLDLDKEAKAKGIAEDTGSWIVYDPETKQIKKRFKTHTAGKSYAKAHSLGFASSEFYFDRVKDQQPVAETVTDVKTEMARVYNRLAPKIERYKDSFLAGQLYDELENIAELHGAEREFRNMMSTARSRAHMEYDTNPGGFQNWFWFLPFEDSVNEGLMKEPTNRKEYLDQRDKLFRMLSVESDSASKQIIKQAIKDLDARYGSAKDPIKEESSTSSEAVEMALIRRVLVAHANLIVEFGLDKVTQAIEEVAYNVGDVDEIGSSDVSGWMNQVKQILGAE